MGSLALNAGPQSAPDHRDRIIASLEQENRNLKERMEEMQLSAQQANKVVEQGVSELRKILFPLHQAMRLVFGEIEKIAPNAHDSPAHSPQQSDKKRAVWESWKKKLGGQQADFIDALLEHEQMTAAQLRVAMQCGKNAVYQVASKLGKLGLVEQKGGKYSLKEL